MALWLKQSTAVTVKVGPFVDSTDGVTAETALTIAQADIRLSKNGGAFAQTANVAGATHDENGYYGVPLDTTDTATLGTLRVAVNETGALPVWQDFMVVPANVWDSMFGADALQVDVAQWLGTAAATPTTAGVPEVDVTFIAGAAVSTTTAQLGVNVVQVSADATAADNLEAAYDGTGYEIIRQGAATAGGAATITLDGGASTSDDFYNNTIIQITSGTGVGQSRVISDYVGVTQVATVNGNWVTQPVNGTGFRILPFGAIPGATAPTSAEVADAVWDEARAGHVAAGSFGEGVVVEAMNSGAITADALAADTLTAAKVAADVSAEIADAVLDEAMSGHTTVGTLGQVLQPARTGTAQAATASTITLDTGASATDDFYVGGLIQITGATGAGQARLITDYNGTTKAATVNSNWVTNPTDGQFVIWPGDSVTSVWDELRANHTAVSSFGEYVKASVTHYNGTAGTFTAGRPETNTSHIAGAAVSTTTAQLGVNVVQLSADSVAADNAEAFFDGTGYAGTNNAIPSVTTVTGNVNGNVGGNVTGTVGSVTGAVGSVTGSVGSVAAGGITAASFGADAIDAAALKTDAADEVATRVWAAASRTLTKHPALQKNTASQRVYFLMVDATDGITPETGLTVTAQRSIDGGIFNAATGAVTEVSVGWYYLTTSAADTNGDSLVFQFSATGAGTRTYWVLTY